jgi:hypothetical protein
MQIRTKWVVGVSWGLLDRRDQEGVRRDKAQLQNHQ